MSRFGTYSKALFSVVIFLLAGGVADLRAEFRCSNAEYRGTWAFYTTGAILQLPPQAAALVGGFAQAGTFTSDGLGNVTIESTATYNGLPQPANIPATYTVTPDCVMIFNLTLPPPLGVPSRFAGVMSDGMRQMNLTIIEPPGTLVVGEHFKQDIRFCGQEDFSGAYQIDLGGSVTAPPARAGRFHRFGRLVADGNGRFTASTLANYNGRQAFEDFSGTYSVNARCFVTLTYSFQGENFSVVGPIAGHGETVVLHVYTPGWIVSGVLRTIK